MPNVNGKNFDYGTAGVKAAKKEAAKTGKKITYNYGGGGVVPKGNKEKKSSSSGGGVVRGAGAATRGIRFHKG